MRLNAKLIGASETKKLLDKFSKSTGKAVETGIKEIAMSSARALCIKVQPFGVKASRGKQFIENVGRQVDQAFFGVNLGAYPATNDIKQAHYAARRNGKVPPRQFRKERGKKWLGLISESDKQSYRVKAQAKAGRAKGAWVESGNSLGVAKMSGIPQWISRHDSTGYGGHKMEGRSLSAQVSLWNKTPYIRSIQPDSAVKAALAQGRKNGIKRMEKIIKKVSAQ